MAKIIKLTENDLIKLVRRVIKEQKTFDLGINPGQTLEGELSGDVLTLMSQMGVVHIFKVKTTLPKGKLMFLFGKDGRYYGYDKRGKKHEIFLIEKRK